MEKTEWPTSQKLSELRESGQFPHSSAALKMILCAVLLVVSATLLERWQRLFVFYHDLFKAGLDLDGNVSIQNVLQEIYVGLQTMAWSVLVVTACYYLLCSRFLFRLSLFRFDLSRFSPFSTERGKGIFSNFLVLLGAVIAALGFGILILYSFASHVIILLNHDLPYFIGWPRQFFSYPLALAVVALVVAAVVIWFLSWRAFMMRHRMSIKELREESGG